MRRAICRRLAFAVTALCLAATAWAATATTADAQTSEEGVTAVDSTGAVLTAEAIVDMMGFDLIGQTAATSTSPPIIHVRVAEELSRARLLRARLYAPVTTRADLLASVYGPYDSPPTPLISEWIVEDPLMLGRDDQGFIFSVSIQPPDVDLAGPAILGDGRPLPLRLEAVDADGAVVGALVTFLTPGADAVVDAPPLPLTVAVVLDLRLPPSHLADGGATVGEDRLDRVVGLAEVLIERQGVPLSVVVSPETLDALALIGDDTSVAALRTALQGRQLLTTTWTGLNLFDWTWAVRLDVVVDGLRRGAEALRWAGLEASTVMHVDHPLTLRTVRAVTEAAAGPVAFMVDGDPGRDGPVAPVTLVADPAESGNHLAAQADPLLGAMLKYPDPELGAQWALAELSRMAAAGTAGAVVVSAAADPGRDTFHRDPPYRRASSSFEPAALELLLDGIDASPSLRPATVDDVLAHQAPVGTYDPALAGRRRDPGDFNLYLARRVQVEHLLEAYESFLSDDPFLTAPLRTLLAVSAGQHLTTGERTGFLDAVDRAVAQGTTGVEFLGRGPITVTERRAELPVTLVNNRSAPVTVALELASEEVDLAGDGRPVLTLQPGRNDLTVPVEASESGRTDIRVTVTTPDESGIIVLTTGTFSVRFTDADGLGFLILVLAAAVLAAWWLHTLRRRSADADMGGATVAASASAGDAET
ncbi:MAG: DUF6049 family protein [Acidimicrobiaceae bacterium]|nr:DUF6049 family protein [Acidimicrobiaceae bacterium]